MRIQCSDRCEGQATVHFLLDHEVGNSASQSVSGQIRGPFCRHSRTLPSNFVVNNGKTIMVDPCFWTPKLPFLYELKLAYESETGPQKVEFTIGLRWCITDRNGLRVNGKGYVVRAITAGDEPDFEALRAASASLVMPKYSEQSCQTASELGVLIVCTDRLAAEQAEVVHRFPAVQFARGASMSPDIVALVDDTPQQHSVCLTAESELSGDISDVQEMPRFIVRQRAPGSLADMRSECDRLQRDVARFGQFAGYLIDSQC